MLHIFIGEVRRFGGSIEYQFSTNYMVGLQAYIITSTQQQQLYTHNNSYNRRS